MPDPAAQSGARVTRVRVDQPHLSVARAQILKFRKWYDVELEIKSNEEWYYAWYQQNVL